MTQATLNPNVQTAKPNGRRAVQAAPHEETCPVALDLRGRNVVVIIPAYNEERFIGSVVLKTRRLADIVLVVDDGSQDATAELAAAAGAQVVSHDENRGKGAALNTAFCRARDLRPEAVVMLDADGQHSPEELARVVEPVINGRADVVVGSRYLQPRSSVPRHRIWGHWAFNLVTRLASGVPASDSQSGYRAFSPRALEAISFSSQGFSVESEMQFLAHQYGLRFAEVPITIQYLDKPKRSVLGQGLSVLNGVLRLTGQYRPLLFFGVPGLLLILGGMAWGMWVVDIFNRTKQLAVGYALISVLLSLLGLVMLSTGFTLHSIRGLLLDLLKSQDSGIKNTSRKTS
jgi:glycosyltransferase involved in cell wall biosynthesis